MITLRNTSIATLLLVAGLPATAQAPKITGLGQLWYHQVMDSNLRYNPNATTDGANYYNLNSRFSESAFFFRRAEIKFAAAITDQIDYEVMIDPITAGSGRPASDILQDFLIRYKLPNKIEFRVGQFKTMQTLEGMTSSSALMFAERSMLAVRFGDVRERGIIGSVGFGDSNSLNGRFHLGYFNGTNGVKDNDANAQKDIAARLEMNYGKDHHFGLYTLQGSTSASAATQKEAMTFFTGENAPIPAAQVLDNMDKTTNMGAFYRYQTKSMHASAEYITGVLGRRFPSIGTGASTRQHLDQAFTGYNATFAYTIDKHTFAVRYDNLNYNSGDDWYTNYNPYTHQLVDDKNEDGEVIGKKVVARDGDYTPNYTEITVGYTYAFKSNVNIKVNYINRSANFKRPAAGQTGEQGGDSIVVAFQVSF